MVEPISIYDSAGLLDEFQRIPKPQRASELLQAALESLGTINLDNHGVKVGFSLLPFQRYLQRRRESNALELAAWRWAHPKPRATIEHLAGIRTWVGLGEMEHSQFCKKLVDRCLELAQSYPRLRRLLNAQAAEAEYAYASEASFAKEPVRSFAQFQSQLILAVARRDAPMAHSIARGALQIAASAVGALRAGERPTSVFDANLMVSFEQMPPTLSTSKGAANADEVWGGERRRNAHRYLVVVEEVGSDYRGFWIPDVRPGGVPLPGAPKACFFERAQAVHLDDLPPFPIDDEALRGRWRSYLRGDRPGTFAGTLFVSFPVFGGNDESEVVGAVNVNVRSEQTWARTLSQAWLERASCQARFWTTTAYHAYALAQVVELLTLYGKPLTTAQLPMLGGLLPTFARFLVGEEIGLDLTTGQSKEGRR